MPTLFTHPAVPLAIAVGIRNIPPRLLLAGAIVSILPDADVIAFKLGIPYSSDYGHRGFTHSLLFAAIIALIGARRHRSLRARAWQAFWFLFVAGASHGILDAFTNGGLGIALLWPFNNERWFAPAQFIEVSPIGASFFSARGLRVLQSELLYVWLPLGTIVLLAWARSRHKT